MAVETVASTLRRRLRTGLSSFSTTDQKTDSLGQAKRTFRETAMMRWRTVQSAEKQLRLNQLEDLKWRAGGDYQWDHETRVDRRQASRPVITINRFPQAINQVVESERRARGAVQINPVDNGADIETAETLQGIIRHIEDKSGASAIYITAAEHQATMGRGYWRVVTEPVDERSFEMQIRLKWVRNPFMMFCDPAAKEPDRRDIRYAFVVNDMPKDEYSAKYGAESATSLSEFLTAGTVEPDWNPEGHVRVAEYFYVEETPDRLLQLEITDPDILAVVQELTPKVLLPVLKSELPAEWGGKLPPAFEIVDERDTMRSQIKWALIDAEKVLEGNEDKTAGRDVDGQWIPIVQVLGEELDIDGEVDLRGVVRDGRDPQRVYNYEVTSLVETIQLGRTAPWVGYTGQFKGHEKKWSTANTKNWPYLEANPIVAGGQVAPLPQRIVQEPPILAISQAIQQADNDFKTTTRWHDASLGERGPQESGVAIARRQQQDESANAHFPEHMNRAKTFTGDLLIDLIPKTYDTPRILKILGADNTRQTVLVHGGNVPEGFDPQQQIEGVSGIYDLGKGTYDVTVTVGPSFQSKRQEVSAQLAEIIGKNPEIAPMFLDIYFENIDSPVAHKLAKRAAKLLPPQLQDEDATSESAPADLQKIQELEQALEQAGQLLQEAQRRSETDAVKAEAMKELKMADVASRERVATAAGQITRDVARMKAGAERGKTQSEVLLARVRGTIAEQFERLRHELETRQKLTLITAESDADMREASHEHVLDQDTPPPRVEE